MERWLGKIALVTGASVGVGPVICQNLVQRGLKVVGMARRIDKIEEVARGLNGPGKLYPIKCDIGKEDDILKTIKLIKENIGNVHVLINNAGFSRTINLTDGSCDDWKRVFDVNILGLCTVTREVIKTMRERNIPGHIINLNSVISQYVVQANDSYLNVYSTSKFAVSALSETLRQELLHLNSKIKVTIINCGVIKSQFIDSNMENNERETSVKMSSLNQEEISNAVIYVLSTSALMQIPEITLKPWDNEDSSEGK